MCMYCGWESKRYHCKENPLYSNAIYSIVESERVSPWWWIWILPTNRSITDNKNHLNKSLLMLRQRDTPRWRQIFNMHDLLFSRENWLSKVFQKTKIKWVYGSRMLSKNIDRHSHTDKAFECVVLIGKSYIFTIWGKIRPSKQKWRN